MKKDKKEKEKITYIDDGSTVADMSAFGRKKKSPETRGGKNANAPRLLPDRHSTLKEQAQTYFDAVRMMFLPMLVVIGILTVAFLILWFLL